MKAPDNGEITASAILRRMLISRRHSLAVIARECGTSTLAVENFMHEITTLPVETMNRITAYLFADGRTFDPSIDRFRAKPAPTLLAAVPMPPFDPKTLPPVDINTHGRAFFLPPKERPILGGPRPRAGFAE